MTRMTVTEFLELYRLRPGETCEPGDTFLTTGHGRVMIVEAKLRVAA